MKLKKTFLLFFLVPVLIVSALLISFNGSKTNDDSLPINKQSANNQTFNGSYTNGDLSYYIDSGQTMSITNDNITYVGSTINNEFIGYNSLTDEYIVINQEKVVTATFSRSTYGDYLDTTVNGDFVFFDGTNTNVVTPDGTLIFSYSVDTYGSYVGNFVNGDFLFVKAGVHNVVNNIGEVQNNFNGSYGAFVNYTYDGNLLFQIGLGTGKTYYLYTQTGTFVREIKAASQGAIVIFDQHFGWVYKNVTTNSYNIFTSAGSFIIDISQYFYGVIRDQLFNGLLVFNETSVVNSDNGQVVNQSVTPTNYLTSTLNGNLIFEQDSAPGKSTGKTYYVTDSYGNLLNWRTETAPQLTYTADSSTPTNLIFNPANEYIYSYYETSPQNNPGLTFTLPTSEYVSGVTIDGVVIEPNKNQYLYDIPVDSKNAFDTHQISILNADGTNTYYNLVYTSNQSAEYKVAKTNSSNKSFRYVTQTDKLQFANVYIANGPININWWQSDVTKFLKEVTITDVINNNVVFNTFVPMINTNTTISTAGVYRIDLVNIDNITTSFYLEINKNSIPKPYFIPYGATAKGITQISKALALGITPKQIAEADALQVQNFLVQSFSTIELNKQVINNEIIVKNSYSYFNGKSTTLGEVKPMLDKLIVSQINYQNRGTGLGQITEDDVIINYYDSKGRLLGPNDRVFLNLKNDFKISYTVEAKGSVSYRGITFDPVLGTTEIQILNYKPLLLPTNWTLFITLLFVAIGIGLIIYFLWSVPMILNW